MICIENVTKTYGAKVAVNNLNLTIPRGELFAFIGPNGAGKTTTVKMMVGLLRPTAGRITIAGKDITKDHLAAKRVLAYIPDQPFCYDKLSGREFLKFMASMYDLSPATYKTEADKYITLFRMSDYIDELIETYSLGMKQRVIISATLLHNPEVIVVDEPLVGIDPMSARIVKQLFREATREKGTTIFMSTHLLPIAEEIADRIGVLHHGQLVALGKCEELRQTSQISGALEDVFLNIVGEDI
jgi:ABC-2 type transport system ATP-binding protein